MKYLIILIVVFVSSCSGNERDTKLLPPWDVQRLSKIDSMRYYYHIKGLVKYGEEYNLGHMYDSYITYTYGVYGNDWFTFSIKTIKDYAVLSFQEISLQNDYYDIFSYKQVSKVIVKDSVLQYLVFFDSLSSHVNTSPIDDGSYYDGKNYSTYYDGNNWYYIDYQTTSLQVMENIQEMFFYGTVFENIQSDKFRRKQ